MVYNDMPIIIPLLATGYLLTIYLLLVLAQWTMKSSRYAANSMSDAYAPYLPTQEARQKNEVERWSLRVKEAVSLTKRDGVAAKDVMLEGRADYPNIASAGLLVAHSGNEPSACSSAELRSASLTLSLGASQQQKVQQASHVHCPLT